MYKKLDLRPTPRIIEVHVSVDTMCMAMSMSIRMCMCVEMTLPSLISYRREWGFHKNEHFTLPGAPFFLL